MTSGSRPRGAAQRPLAVLSDGSGFYREPGSSVLTRLSGSAALLRDHAAMPANAVLVTARSDHELITELHRLEPEVSGVLLAHTDADRGRKAQIALAGALPIITDLQTTAVAVTAAVLTILARAGLAPDAGHVVIVGAERNPLVARLAEAAGIGEIDRWEPHNAQDLPLDLLLRRAAAVVDLRRAATHRVAANPAGPSPPVIAVDEASTTLLALPGLLAVARATARPANLASGLAVALALVDRTPADSLLPCLSDSGLAGAVAAGAR